MFLANDNAVDELTKSSGTNSLARLASLDDKTKVRELFLRVLGREPDRDELKRSLDYLHARSEEPSGATRQLHWALLAERRVPDQSLMKRNILKPLTCGSVDHTHPSPPVPARRWRRARHR